MSSGDQIFNMLLKGVTKIDTFDNNGLTEYLTLGIKKSMILKYSYEEFLIKIKKMCSSHDNPAMSLDELSIFIKELLPYMDEKYAKFWNEIVEFNYKLQKNNKKIKDLFDMLCANNIFSLNSLKRRNQYLFSKDDYELLRSNLLKSTIIFKLASADKLKNSFNDKYDLIFLSNILSYFRYVWQDNWTIETLIDYINGLDKIESENCDLLLHYVFSGKSNIFTGSQVTIDEIPNSSVITFDSLLQGKEKMIVIKK